MRKAAKPPLASGTEVQPPPRTPLLLPIGALLSMVRGIPLRGPKDPQLLSPDEPTASPRPPCCRTSASNASRFHESLSLRATACRQAQRL